MIRMIEERLREIAAICREFGVLRLEVFGSAAAGGWNPETSDIDFLVTYPAGYDFGPWLCRQLDFQDQLAELLGHSIDLVIAREHFRNPYFEAELQRDRQLVYAADGGDA